MSDDNFFAAFGALANAIGSNPGGDEGSIFPESDARDMRNGAKWIPGEVTEIRRAGKKAVFHQPNSSQTSWYWKLPDGEEIQHGEIG